MTTKQTRRSISINGQLFDRVQRYCKTHRLAVSAYVTQLLIDDLDESAAGRTSTSTPPVAATKPPTGSHGFTF